MALLFVVLGSIWLAKNIKISVGKTIPVILLGGMLGVYALSLIGLLWIVPWLSLVLCLVLAGVLILQYKGNREPLIGKKILFILGGVMILLCICFGNHIIIFADDFAYYATFPKTLYYLNRLPDISNTTYTPYNSYSPIMGLLYYWVMKGFGFFSDGVMFITNNMFYYVMCLPLLSGLEKNSGKIKKMIIIICYVLFPIALQSFSYSTVGVDMAVGCMFGYGLYAILDDEKRDTFYYIRVFLSIFILILVKTPAILFACILALVLIANECKKMGFWKATGFMAVTIGLPYGSWNLWCLLHDMHDYLTVGIICNIRDAATSGRVSIPTYLLDTAVAYIKGLFSININGAGIGFSMIVWLIVLVLGYIYLYKKDIFKRKYVLIIMSLGLISYFLCHLYMYLFVFAANEAESLSSFHRYLLMYLVPIVYFFLYKFFEEEEGTSKFHIVAVVTPMLVLLLNVNYPGVVKYLIPTNYQTTVAEEQSIREDVEKQLLLRTEKDYGKMLIVYNGQGSDTCYTYLGNIVYMSIPQVCLKASIGDNEKIATELKENNITDIAVVKLDEQSKDWIEKLASDYCGVVPIYYFENQ